MTYQNTNSYPFDDMFGEYPFAHPRAAGIAAAIRYLQRHEDTKTNALAMAAAGGISGLVILWIWICI
jgi:hypothetical protein